MFIFSGREGGAIDPWRRMEGGLAEGSRGLKYFPPDWPPPRDFSSIDGKSSVWSAVFLFFNGPPATVTPVAEGGGCSWRPVRTKSRSTCHLIYRRFSRGAYLTLRCSLFDENDRVLRILTSCSSLCSSRPLSQRATLA